MTPATRLATAALGLAFLLPVQGAGAELLAHRAAYSLTLADASATVGLVDVHGGLVMEWQAACDGWTSRQRLGFVAMTDEGPGFSYDVRFTSWESDDATRLRFTVRSYDDGSLFEEFRGEAALDRPGGPGIARFTAPRDHEVRLPAGTLFPTEHIRRLIASARSGESLVSHPVFDGSGPDALTQVTAVIGRPIQGVRGGQDPLAGDARWPISMAYYSFAEASEMPDFEITFQMAENGVVREVVLDYGDFALRAVLETVEPLPTPSC
jgi:hypothetical protein